MCKALKGSKVACGIQRDEEASDNQDMTDKHGNHGLAP
jgi:hypothetical protein